MKIPNQLSREAIEEFKGIFQEEFGALLSDEEVQLITMRLLYFFGILKPPTNDKTNPASSHIDATFTPS